MYDRHAEAQFISLSTLSMNLNVLISGEEVLELIEDVRLESIEDCAGCSFGGYDK